MNRRFIDTDVWQALRKLEPSLKIIYFYIWSKADAAGVYVLDPEYMKIDTGIKLNKKDLEKLPGVKFLTAGKIIFEDYIIVQYNELKENYNPHKPAFRALQKHNLNLSSLNQASFKLVGEGEEEKEGEEENKKEKSEKKSNSSGQEIIVVYPWTSEEFITAWAKWISYKKAEHKFQYKSPQTLQSGLNELSRLSGENEQIAILIIDQSIANTWKGLQPLKKGFQGQNATQPSKFENLAAQSQIADDYLHQKYEGQ